ncbi:MAG: DUF4190 domain-containing protein [Ruminococcus sp.]|nr:DUF4190 domain-containing protein [Ruminococcus sp.]
MNDGMNSKDKHDVYDDPGYTQPPDEPVYFDEHEFRDFQKSEKSGGKTLSVISFIFGIAASFYMFGGFLIVSMIGAGVGAVLGIIALVRKNAGAGLALSGTILSVIVLIMSLYGYFTDAPFFVSKDRYRDRSEMGYFVCLPDEADDVTIDV